MDIDYIVDKLVISFMKVRYLNEKTNETEKNTEISTIIDNLSTVDDKLSIDKNKSKFSEIEKMMYSKKWQYLQHNHKINKINEYLGNIIKDSHIITELCDQICILILDKKIKDKIHLEYDPSQQKIITMNMLKLCDGKYIIDIKNNKK